MHGLAFLARKAVICVCYAVRAVQVCQGRPHVLCDLRLVDDEGRLLPHDGQAIGDLQVRTCAYGSELFLMLAGLIWISIAASHWV